jgi:hypothetical protein
MGDEWKAPTATKPLTLGGDWYTDGTVPPQTPEGVDSTHMYPRWNCLDCGYA